MDTQQLRRLMIIDDMLSGLGLHVRTAAYQLGVSERTIRRDLELLTSVGCQIVRRVDIVHRHYHAGERLFNPAMDIYSAIHAMEGSDHFETAGFPSYASHQGEGHHD